MQSLPWVAQFVLMVLVSDFTQYWVHRAFHAVPLLWRFHAVHHSAEQMDWLAGSRLHLVDIAVTRGLTYVPIYVLGFANRRWWRTSIFVSAQATFIHANVRFEWRWLRWILATPRFHHWHHAAEPEAVDTNFAVHLPVLDVLFGTAYLPDRWPSAYGIAHGATRATRVSAAVRLAVPTGKEGCIRCHRRRAGRCLGLHPCTCLQNVNRAPSARRAYRRGSPRRCQTWIDRRRSTPGVLGFAEIDRDGSRRYARDGRRSADRRSSRETPMPGGGRRGRAGSTTSPFWCRTAPRSAARCGAWHEQRWPLTGASDHLVSEALYLDDPDGLGIEIYRDRPRDDLDACEQARW